MGDAIAPEAVEGRKSRWREFLKPQAPPGFLFLIRYNDPDANLPPPVPHWPDRQAERVERIWAVYRHSLEMAAWLDDDSVPHLNLMTGTEIFAEAFGCRVHRPTNTNPFALPLIHAAGEVARLKVPDESTSTLAYHFDMADELLRRAGPRGLLHLVDVQSPMDIAALIWEKSAFYTAMIEAPEAVRELAAKVQQLQAAFFDEWFRRYGTDYVAHFPCYFMSGGVTLSEDEIGIVSPRIFEEFFLPELVALSERYGGIGIHCCADARHQWPGLKKVPGLRLLNLVKPPTRTPAEYVTPAYEFFADHCVQWHSGWAPRGPVETWRDQFPRGSRVVLEVVAPTREEAVALGGKLRALQAGEAW